MSEMVVLAFYVIGFLAFKALGLGVFWSVVASYFVVSLGGMVVGVWQARREGYLAFALLLAPNAASARTCIAFVPTWCHVIPPAHYSPGGGDLWSEFAAVQCKGREKEPPLTVLIAEKWPKGTPTRVIAGRLYPERIDVVRKNGVTIATLECTGE
jgi:hypothetical protein